MAEYIDIDAPVVVTDTRGRERETTVRHILEMNKGVYAAADVRPVKWIPVTERLPEDLTRVIVFCEDGVSYGLCEHLIAGDEEVVEWHDFLHYPITPTHWMPLPEPPKEEKT